MTGNTYQDQCGSARGHGLPPCGPQEVPTVRAESTHDFRLNPGHRRGTESTPGPPGRAPHPRVLTLGGGMQGLTAQTGFGRRRPVPSESQQSSSLMLPPKPVLWTQPGLPPSHQVELQYGWVMAAQPQGNGYYGDGQTHTHPNPRLLRAASPAGGPWFRQATPSPGQHGAPSRSGRCREEGSRCGLR